MNTKINKEIALQMIEEMPIEKKEVLKKSLERNFALTSSYVMEHGTMVVYKQGFYLKLFGTRCSFTVFAYDKDGEFEFSRKPKEENLRKLYQQDIDFCESDFR